MISRKRIEQVSADSHNFRFRSLNAFYTQNLTNCSKHEQSISQVFYIIFWRNFALLSNCAAVSYRVFVILTQDIFIPFISRQKCKLCLLKASFGKLKIQQVMFFAFLLFENTMKWTYEQENTLF